MEKKHRDIHPADLARRALAENPGLAAEAGVDPETARKAMTLIAQSLFSLVHKQLVVHRRETVFGTPSRPAMVVGLDHGRKIKFAKKFRNGNKNIQDTEGGKAPGEAEG